MAEIEKKGDNEKNKIQNNIPLEEVNKIGNRNNIVVKVGMVGDAQVGKTSLMVKYVEGKFDEDYIHTLGIIFINI